MDSLDNKGTQRLGEVLRNSIDEGARLSIIASCFTIFAYGKLKEELQKVEELRFIFNEPTFAKTMQEGKEPREFVLSRLNRERALAGTGLELTLRNNLNQRALARECAQWVRSKGRFRSAQRAGSILNSGLYHVENCRGESQGFAGTPANAFSLPGLGYESLPQSANFIWYFNTTEKAANLKKSFDNIWNNQSLLEEVTESVATQLETLYRENAPEFLYFLTIYHIFRDFLEDAESDPIKPGLKFEESVIWNKLYDFQKDAVVGAIRKLEKYKGCIIADSVGLGKTFEALAVIKYYVENNGRVLVLTPKRLSANWTLWRQHNDDRNILAEDRLDYDVLNHTDLSRVSGMSGDIDLEHLRWGNYQLLVIDESHNFRNKSTHAERRDRYTRLIEDVIKKGIRTKVLMLSATPVNNRLSDLRNQLELITEGDDAYLQESAGIESLNNVVRTAQQRFKEWSDLPQEERTTERFVAMVNADYFKLLDTLTIARSRKHIVKYYGASAGTFPRRLPPLNFKNTIDTENELPPISELNEMIAGLSLAQYRLLDYVLPQHRSKYVAQYEEGWGKDFDSQMYRTKSMINLMRVNILKRMESSVYSFVITLERILEGTRSLERALEGRVGQKDGYAPKLEQDFEDAEEIRDFLVGSGKMQVDLRDVDMLKLKPDLKWDISTLEKLRDYAKKVTPQRDAKLRQLRDFIRSKVKNPHNPGNRKILLFTAFADTADYLYEQLAGPLHAELGLETAEVHGECSRTYSLKMKRVSFEEILAHFAPQAKELPAYRRDIGQVDLVIATDCISEGQNLQDCDCVVNYDIHWNPVRIIQRFGRVDRLGSPNSCIQLVNFWPDLDLDEYINLENRVKGRMVLLNTSATGEEDILENSEEMHDLQYRRRQLQQLQNEVLDLEDIAGGISITDLAFEDFRVELNRYSKEHPNVLERAPQGLHAVAPIPEKLKGEMEPGVIFCLQQNDLSHNPKDGNPIFPYYLLYVTKSGEVRGLHTNPRKALDYLRAACLGQSEPLEKLCRAFNRETGDGTNMETYSRLLNAAVAKISGQQEKSWQESLFSLGEVGRNAVLGWDDYSLVSLVVLR